ncbi:MAG TPA: NUDIX hydrolase [Candidatus Saccharimonadales bacterium]|nr:NUDIX hydrolase [Candidatus Saccharimonadales bacterium]
MNYTISEGIEEKELKLWLEKALKKYGLYKGKYVNYTNAKIAPIVMCTVVYEGKILLVKRGYGLADAEGYWSTVNGFIDEPKPVKEIAKQEIKEELSVSVKGFQIKMGNSYTLKNPKEKRSYIVFPCLVSLKEKPAIRLNEEHTEFIWIKRSELASYENLDDLAYAIDCALSLM